MSWKIDFFERARWQFNALDNAEWRIAEDLIIGFATDGAPGDEQHEDLNRDGVHVLVERDEATKTITVISVAIDEDEARAARRAKGLLDLPEPPEDP